MYSDNKNYSLCDKKIIEILNVLKVDWSVLNHKTAFITQRTSTHLMQLMCFLIPSNHFSINHQNQMQKKNVKARKTYCVKKKKILMSPHRDLSSAFY